MSLKGTHRLLEVCSFGQLVYKFDRKCWIELTFTLVHRVYPFHLFIEIVSDLFWLFFNWDLWVYARDIKSFFCIVYIENFPLEMELQQQKSKHLSEQLLAEMEQRLATGDLLVEEKLRLQLEIKKKVRLY